MSFNKLYNLLTPDRRALVLKSYNEMNGIAYSAFPTVSDRENKKGYFLQLVKENKELLENEKEYCRERFIYAFELTNAANKLGEPRECNSCKTTRYSNKFCEK